MTEETEWEARERCGEKPFDDKIEEIIKEFDREFTNGSHTIHLGWGISNVGTHQIPDMDGANQIRNFLRQSLRQYRQSILDKVMEKMPKDKFLTGISGDETGTQLETISRMNIEANNFNRCRQEVLTILEEMKCQK